MSVPTENLAAEASITTPEKHKKSNKRKHEDPPEQKDLSSKKRKHSKKHRDRSEPNGIDGPMEEDDVGLEEKQGKGHKKKERKSKGAELKA